MRWMRWASVVIPLLFVSPVLAATDDLKIAVVDMEGGAAVLFRTPEGKSLLIDTGWGPNLGPWAPGQPAFSSTGTDRIVAAAGALGITRIDYLLMTHYHVDHLSGVNALLARIPVDTFVDHGPNRETIPADASPERIANAPQTRYPEWVRAYQGHHHITAVAGDRLEIGTMTLDFVASDGKVLTDPLPGAGQPNPLCATQPPPPRRGGEENDRSLGVRIRFSATTLLNLGDLTWDRETALLCPMNKVGKVDVLFATGHGMDLSNSPATASLDPELVIMQNGPSKGGDPVVLRTIKSYSHLRALWQLHAIERHLELNGDSTYIANLKGESDTGNSIYLAVARTGAIAVTNARNNFSECYGLKEKP